ncbi:ion channel [Carboxylicivirga sp. N1Y90]|uniref:ion channel n=1 Tax=Carboxylicivirga fragile TaxID=3417571 RepID=UPI003D344F8C|nr:two pore domain potassium channel family protein [Marinilabiliaceae bacterium N1Y90]
MIKKWISPWLNYLPLLISNWGLFLLLCATLFLLPLLSSLFMINIFDLCLSFIIMASIFATRENKRALGVLQAVAAIFAVWISRLIEMDAFHYIAKLVLVLFFLTRVFKFIGQVSRKQNINSVVIIEAINGYLLLGVAFGVLIDFMLLSHTGAFNFLASNETVHFFDPYYYAFVTMSTLGYGDLLPITPPAKAIALFITLCGQFYLVTIMAFLIGRLLSQNDKKD